MIHIESLLSAIVFVVLDGIYLNLVQKYFNNQIKIIQGTDIKINLLYTAITYIFLILL